MTNLVSFKSQEQLEIETEQKRVENIVNYYLHGLDFIKNMQKPEAAENAKTYLKMACEYMVQQYTILDQIDESLELDEEDEE